VYTQVTPTQFSFLQSLPLLLLIMAGGAGTVGGATFGALALGVFGYIGTISTFIYQIAQLLPGLVGVGLGKQPNGVAADISTGLAKLVARLPGHPAEQLRLASVMAPVRVSGPVSGVGPASPSAAAGPSAPVGASPSSAGAPGPESPSGAAVPSAAIPDTAIPDAGITVEGRS
jgi:branched-chain amino acid transport system permease protein